MVGRSLRALLPEAVYLTRGHCDLEDSSATARAFAELRPDVVIHLAALVGGIQDNVSRPYEFVHRNVLINTNVLHAALAAGTRHVIGVSSTCAYPSTVDQYPMHEGQVHAGAPAMENLPYGYSKRLMAVALDAAAKQFGIRATVLYPSNLYGPHDAFEPQRSHLVAALIRKVSDAKREGWTELPLLGTGRPLRQFAYVDDLSRAICNVVATGTVGHFNVATPENLSIDQIAAVVQDAMDCRIPRVYNGKLDGQFRKDASSDAFLALFPDFRFTPLAEGVHKTCRWYLENHMEKTA